MDWEWKGYLSPASSPTQKYKDYKKNTETLSVDPLLKSAEDEAAWRLTERDGQSRTAAHTYQWHWSLSKAWQTAETAICTFLILLKKCVVCSNIKSSQGCFDELGGIWDEWAISVSFSFKNSRAVSWGPKKRPFIVLSSSDPKTDPSPLPGPSSQEPLGPMFYQVLNRNAASLQGPDRLQTRWAFSCSALRLSKRLTFLTLYYPHFPRS